MVEPPSDEEANQRRCDDDPAENADLTDEARYRWLAFAQPLLPAFLLLSNRDGHPIRGTRLGLDGFGIHDSPPNTPGRSGRR
jgi:hypothetical protein